jgi:creatinine amidohydrolase/Fe(II)-dependent formamide hydrolase-like protein
MNVSIAYVGTTATVVVNAHGKKKNVAFAVADLTTATVVSWR